MDAQCSQLLPHVCGVLADNRQPMTDSSCFEKLLDWFTSLLNKVSAEQLLEENQCILMLFQHVLSVGDPDPNLLTFSMRLVGMLAGHEPGFKYLLMKNIVQRMFGENIYTHELWRDASVRRAWIHGLLSMVQHKQAVFFLSESGIIEVMLNLQMDSSLFVASASNQLVAHIFLVCLKMELENSECTEIANWPESAQTILTFLEKSLMSGSSFSVTQAIKALTLVYNGCTDSLSAILWSCIAVAVNSLLDQKTVHGAKHFEELLLSVARFPAFANPESDLWILIKRALKNLNPLQSGSLALGILKLENCPQAVSLQAMCVLLHPLDCVLKASVSCGQPGMLDELVSDPAEVDKLLSTKPSCVALLCQCLCHLHQLCHMSSLSIKIPHESVLNCVVTVLQFCIGQASSSVGSNLCRFLIGCLKVQRPALDALGSLALWPLNQHSLLKIYNVLLAYLENPETDPMVLKKSLQASLKWLQVSSVSSDSEHWHCSCRFLQDLFPVLMKRMCSPSWEIRDSTLEFLALLIDSVKEKGEFQKVLQTSRVLQLVLELLKDPESYVRASAVSCLGKIVTITHLYPALSEESWLPINNEDIVSHLLDILSQDTEGFPRRAVVKVFTEWLKRGDMQHLKDPKQTLSRILEVTRNDLDWEVKVNALDLADVFMDQTLAIWNFSSCPYTVDLHCNTSNNPTTEAIQKCDEVGLFQFLLSSLCDCDRPVALRSCDMLCALKAKLCEGESATEYVPSELYDIDWLESILKDRCLKGHKSSNSVAQEASWLTDILKKIDLVSLKISLSMGSGHVHETPQSLLYDIKASLLGLEEHDADCY
ncbi:BRCA1-associated ATM activator 1 [Xenopus laevis]|uniref:BRCA1-associated ATM activator 1 n=2 Tax=Xenopus laevis TaxID=8355 RepID=A0A1L8EXS0_XENLA|nr:BRCA1-associated ATM activator 1 [Xenopus laevis]OCT64123.1 hypothetical protein XELAEV_18045224mg [Xenopus laevis]